MRIPFVKQNFGQPEYDAVLEAMKDGHVGGNGPIGKEVQKWLINYLNVSCVLLTTSCTHAIETALMALKIGPGDEVILPSFSFVSTATAIVRVGATPVFAEIEESTFNIDPDDVIHRITRRTKAILIVHYAGFACKLDELLSIADTHNLFLIEDAAHALGATYNDHQLGSIGHIGCFSFHSTKNIVAGEGGAFVTKSENLCKLAEIIREKGTNRSQFLRGEIDKYTWIDIGSSYVISDLLASLLRAQLLRLDEITNLRREIWSYYYDQMANMEAKELIIRHSSDSGSKHNGHIYSFRVIGNNRDTLLKYLHSKGVGATFHFVPLHSSPFGQKVLGYKLGDLEITERVSSSLIRLPIYPDLSKDEVDYILNVLESGLNFCKCTKF